MITSTTVPSAAIRNLRVTRPCLPLLRESLGHSGLAQISNVATGSIRVGTVLPIASPFVVSGAGATWAGAVCATAGARAQADATIAPTAATTLEWMFFNGRRTRQFGNLKNENVTLLCAARTPLRERRLDLELHRLQAFALAVLLAHRTAIPAPATSTARTSLMAQAPVALPQTRLLSSLFGLWVHPLRRSSRRPLPRRAFSAQYISRETPARLRNSFVRCG
jgi:hypothetical protein